MMVDLRPSTVIQYVGFPSGILNSEPNVCPGEITINQANFSARYRFLLLFLESAYFLPLVLQHYHLLTPSAPREWHSPLLMLAGSDTPANVFSNEFSPLLLH